MDKTNEKPNIEVFDYSTIPKFMQEHGKFCLWRLLQKPGKDKPDKIPYQVNGKRADATNPEHFSSFEDVVTAYGKGGYAGIGIGCFAPIKFCDVDDCMGDEKLDTRRNIAFNASGFKEAANHLNTLISKNGATLLEYSPAYTTNLSLSCELYLKALLCDDTTGHSLVSLFEKVDDSIKKSIIRNYENKCEEYNKRLSYLMILKH